MQIQLAQICMEGMTWHWFTVLSNSDPHLHWASFKCVLLERYGNHQMGSSTLEGSVYGAILLVDLSVQPILLVILLGPVTKGPDLGHLIWVRNHLERYW
ncbi:hypothetical protein GLYMA_09G118700v4 [Glycine max]|uniref:Uncharacterized protein n=1 Tax=Glycine max TaxID=3847 RepID=K7LDD3_SOYBN|nr:hypothetical protein GYH30_024778 [Glycine max]KAH1042641.1 hypothetical protein GYH30_024778 [Glycine max]KRH38211.1 hypothetical protein GLYMA_09G118700v4 [Glycine max]KRH38212.1 hypothetical protein GLYMA_09G118700v4 [Glycine max]